MTKVINGAAGVGKHIADGPLTTTITNAEAPSLLLNEIEQRVVRVRPTATPVDQISRMIGSRKAGSMVVDFYSVDTKPSLAIVEKVSRLTGNQAMVTDHPCFRISTDHDEYFAPTETILLPDATGDNGQALELYVDSVVANNGGLDVIAVNAVINSDGDPTGEPHVGDRLVRMGRAASELDMQTAQYEALPQKSSNNCQIFKAQIEQSTVMSLTHKEVGWSFSDQEEVAVMDMRMGMERNFLFGAKARITNRRTGNETFLTQGIWNQAEKSYTIGESTLTHAGLVKLMREAFTGDAAGSTRKILIAGSGLIERLNSLEPNRTVGAMQTVTRWGIDFSEIVSKFGTLSVIHSEVFDNCGHEDDGFILDPEYITKYTFLPFSVETLDLKGAGIRNVDAMVITEASCLVLRHPKTHLRVIG